MAGQREHELSLAIPTMRISAALDQTCDPSRVDPASVPLPPSPAASPAASRAATMPPVISPVVAESTMGPGELDGSARPSPCPEMRTQPQGFEAPAPAAPATPAAPVEESPISFEDFATRYRQSQRKQAQRKRLEQRLRATKVSIGVSARMIRIGSTVQRGLVEALKQDDKANFINLYHFLYDLQESCVSSLRQDDHQDSLDEQGGSSADPDLDPSTDFFHQLSPQSRTDLLEILRLVRSDPQFLVDRLRSLTPAQLAAFTAPSTALDAGDATFSSSSRSRTHYSFNRNPAQSAPFKDHAYAFERTDPLSILFCNVFTAPLETETPEARLRLDIWSSVCAQLMSHGSSKFFPLVSQILSFCATGSNWKARPKFELYLMDILQTGAFLLEHTDTPAGLDFAAETMDPLRTEVAEEFFASAVDDLFCVLDDPDAGFPRAVLQFAKAVLRKLPSPDMCSRFLEYIFLQWFFPKFLSSALTYPETHGLLLDFHIRKEARDKLLNQVGLRAYSQFFAVLRSMHHFSLRPTVKERVDSMISRFQSPVLENSRVDLSSSTDTRHPNSCSSFLLLSAADILTLLNGLFPQLPSSLHTSPSTTGVPSWSGFSTSYSLRPEPLAEPGFYRANNSQSPRPPSQSGSIFSMESSLISMPESSLSQNASRIRFELTDLDEPIHRPNLEHPSEEHWTIYSISKDGQDLSWSLLPDFRSGQSKAAAAESDDDAHTSNLAQEENHEATQTAIIRLVEDSDLHDQTDYEILAQPAPSSLRQRFSQAMASAHNSSDFVGAHYWWNASRQLRQERLKASSPGDSWILGPMHRSCINSLKKSRAVVERCESDFVFLDHSLRRLQTQLKSLMSTIDKIRTKMWYMTDVNNSKQYEEARHVAMALKTMIYSARPFDAPEESRARTAARSLGGSLFQKPELQIMNMMKAPSSQGGPKKLSDEQVELTRKWLSVNAIENFCKGEERIHRFCYEVRMSINRLAGETMSETPVLWASELFQRERARYERNGSRPFSGLYIPTTLRPSTAASEEQLHTPLSSGFNLHTPSPLSPLSHDIPPSINDKQTIPRLASDKWRNPRDSPSVDVGSIAGSPGRAASTSTGDTYSTFWSGRPRHAAYAESVSSVYSRPPSMYSETLARPIGQSERTPHGQYKGRPQARSQPKTQGKTAFMDNLKQTLTSLLLTDLGSPVWSCGSETDAWFTNTLDKPHVRMQMQRRATVQKFYDDYDQRSKHLRERRRSSGGQRSRSLDPPVAQSRATMDTTPPSNTDSGLPREDFQQEFSYKAVFHRLIEVFSRHGNPFVKLNALRDLRALVVASLNSAHDASSSQDTSGPGNSEPAASNPSLHRRRSARHSFSEIRTTAIAQTDTGLPTSTPPESVTYGSQRSDYLAPSDDQIVATLRDLILEVKPKTLFRDLQFISAFVPADQLSRTDRGTAFLHFGLAALSLKDEVCHSMVEIADRIVSQELMRRHPPPGSDFYPQTGHAVEVAASMWIITAKEGNPVAQRELAILYLTHPELLPRVTLPLTRPRDTFKAEMMYLRGKDSKSDPQSMCLALHWMQLSASGGDLLARNRLREREEFDSIA